MPSPENKQTRNKPPTTQHPTTQRPPNPPTARTPNQTNTRWKGQLPATLNGLAANSGLKVYGGAFPTRAKPGNRQTETTNHPTAKHQPNPQTNKDPQTKQTRGGKANYRQLSAAFCRQSETCEPIFRDAGGPRQRPPKTHNQTRTKTKQHAKQTRKKGPRPASLTAPPTKCGERKTKSETEFAP